MAKNHQPIDIRELAEKWAKGKLTQEERDRFEKWYADFNDEEINLTDSRHAKAEEIRKAILNKINAEIYKENPSSKKGRVVPLWTRIAAAACILLFISVGGYFLFRKQATQQIAQNTIHNIVPGSNKATLTLANGQKIILTKGLSGKLAQQGNTLVQVNSGNAITYTTATAKSNLAIQVQFNTLSTAHGEQSPYPLVLVDGTKVWLNAESSITFPTSFNGKERIVKITGEAYFEVSHNAAQPFKVTVRDQTIEDLGTHFNINAYTDEPEIKTTLIQGRVKVSKGVQTAYLKPGQQAVMKPSGSSIIVQSADIDQVIAWKNGDFAFEGTPLKTIMRQISRWYDVEISYQGTIADVEFGGSISRSKNINEVLNVLESTQGVHFKIEGRRILVMP